MLSRTTRSVAILSSVAVAIHGGCAAAATAQQPNSGSRTGPPRVGTVDTLHGTLVPDPYRWLERTDSSPVRAWVRDQDRAARERITSYGRRADVRAAVERIASAESFNPAPHREGGRYFITRVAAVGPQRGVTVVVRDSATGAMTTLIDAADQARTGRPAREVRPSPDGLLVAYGVGSDSTEWLTAHVRSVATRADLTDSVRGIYRFADSVTWARDRRVGFYYTRFKIPAGPLPGRPLESGAVYFHRVGDPQSADQLVFDAGSASEILTPTAVVTSDGQYLVISVRRGTATASAVYVQRLADSAQRSLPPQ